MKYCFLITISRALLFILLAPAFISTALSNEIESYEELKMAKEGHDSKFPAQSQFEESVFERAIAAMESYVGNRSLKCDKSFYFSGNNTLYEVRAYPAVESVTEISMLRNIEARQGNELITWVLWPKSTTYDVSSSGSGKRVRFGYWERDESNSYFSPSARANLPNDLQASASFSMHTQMYRDLEPVRNGGFEVDRWYEGGSPFTLPTIYLFSERVLYGNSVGLTGAVWNDVKEESPLLSISDWADSDWNARLSSPLEMDGGSNDASQFCAWIERTISG